MKKILIADANKASLVMTSEAFKDNFPGIGVCVAHNSASALSMAKENEDIDVFVIDFDLPDANGAETALQLKKLNSKPILITGFDRTDTAQTIEKLLGRYKDCLNWIKKPVEPDVLTAIAQRFCTGEIRSQKRIPCMIPALVKIKSLQFYAFIEDCSLDGVKLKPTQSYKDDTLSWGELLLRFKKVTEKAAITVTIPSLQDIKQGKLGGAPPNFLFHELNYSESLGGTVAWMNEEMGRLHIGVQLKDQRISKELFEIVVSSQSKQNKNCQFQTLLKPSRA